MADETPARRVLPARQRRESTAKRRASSPPPPPSSKPATPKVKTPATPASSEGKPKRKYEKRIKTVHVSTPSRSASTPTSTGDEILPTKVTSARPLPASSEKQSEDLSLRQFQSVVDSAILAASLHRSRMQWLCEGVFKKYWTKPVRRKKVVEEPPGNPDVKSMQKLGTASITIEPHTFDATFYIVREPLPPPVYKPPVSQPILKPSTPAAAGPAPVTPAVPAPTPAPASPAPSAALKAEGNNSVSATPSPAPTSIPTAGSALPPSPLTSSVPTQAPVPAGGGAVSPASTPAAKSSAVTTPVPTRPATPPAGAKTTDPVIQMLASRAATDNHLKELMKVVATSKASPEQLREFQGHIDEFNAIVKRQEAEREKAKAAGASLAAHPSYYRSSPLNPNYVQPRPEPRIKHVVLEFTSQPNAGQSANTDRWLFPEYAVLDTQYGGTEMTCSFFVERKGSDVLASLKDLTTEEMQAMSSKWNPDLEYFQPVTMIVKAAQHRTIETIARSARSLPEVLKHMQEVMEKKTRAPPEYLVLRLPREKVDNTVDFVDSAVELSGEDDELKDHYPL